MAALSRARRGVVLVPALAMLLVAGAGRAAELDVYPVIVKLSPAKIRDTVTLSNNAETLIVIEARIFRWTQTATGDRLVETNEAIAAPPVFTLPPLARQVVPVGLRRKPEYHGEPA